MKKALVKMIVSVMLVIIMLLTGNRIAFTEADHEHSGSITICAGEHEHSGNLTIGPAENRPHQHIIDISQIAMGSSTLLKNLNWMVEAPDIVKVSPHEMLTGLTEGETTVCALNMNQELALTMPASVKSQSDSTTTQVLSDWVLNKIKVAEDTFNGYSEFSRISSIFRYTDPNSSYATIEFKVHKPSTFEYGGFGWDPNDLAWSLLWGILTGYITGGMSVSQTKAFEILMDVLTEGDILAGIEGTIEDGIIKHFFKEYIRATIDNRFLAAELIDNFDERLGLFGYFKDIVIGYKHYMYVTYSYETYLVTLSGEKQYVGTADKKIKFWLNRPENKGGDYGQSDDFDFVKLAQTEVFDLIHKTGVHEYRSNCALRCSVCTYGKRETNALWHDLKWVPEKDSKGYAGTHFRECTKCGSFIPGDFPVTAGNYSEKCSSFDCVPISKTGNHTKTCKECKAQIVEEHRYVRYDDDSCRDCGEPRLLSESGWDNTTCPVCFAPLEVKQYYGKDGVTGHYYECNSTLHYGAYTTKVFSHTYDSSKPQADGMSKSSYHTRMCKICGPVYLQHNYSTSYDQYSHFTKCRDCEYGDYDQHTFTSFSQKKPTNATYHIEKCNCGYSQEAKHDFGTTYVWNGTNGHYKKCSICGYETSNVSHSLSYTKTSKNHTYKCTVCDWVSSGPNSHTMEYVTTPSAHTYKCKYCDWGSSEPTNHTFTYVWNGTNGHYKKCSVCGYETSNVSHSLSYTKTSKNHTYKCTVCDWVSSGPNNHSFSYVTSSSGHYQKCKYCEYTTSTSSHSYNYVKNGTNGHYKKCSVCEYKTSNVSHSLSYTKTSTKHTYKCSVCDWVSSGPNNHSFSYVTSSSGHYQKCKYCEYKTSTSSHSYNYVKNGTNGHYKKCSICEYKTSNVSHSLSYTKTSTKHTYKCSVCDWVSSGPNNHTWGSWTSSGTSGCYRKCTYCGYQSATSAHSYGSYIKNGTNGHYRKCSACEYTSSSSHSLAYTYTGTTHTYKCSTCDWVSSGPNNHTFASGSKKCSYCPYKKS